MALVGVVTVVWSLVALDARATYGARTTADEPQYLLSALSLFEDRSLAITDELAEQRWREFHEADLPVQTTAVDDDGTLVSPHDPLLPAYLALPMGLAGWAGAKAALALLGGALAALLVWVAVRRFAVPVGAAALVVSAFSLTAPLVAYSTQVYPELPAALAVTVAIAALTGPLGRGGRWVLAAAVVALPWLGVKYALVAAALAAVGLARLWRAPAGRAAAMRLAGGLAVAGAGYLVAHRLLYGGWTVYAAGDHFTGGELSVVGADPDYCGQVASPRRAAARPRLRPDRLVAGLPPAGSRPCCTGAAPTAGLGGADGAPRRGLGNCHVGRARRCTAGGGPVARRWSWCRASCSPSPGGPGRWSRALGGSRSPSALPG